MSATTRTCAKFGLHLCECGAPRCIIGEFRALQTPEGRRAALQEYRRELKARGDFLERVRARKAEADASVANTQRALGVTP